MKVPLKWLGEYVDVSLPVAELAERLTLAGLEVTSIRFIGLPVPDNLTIKLDQPGPVWDRDKILIGRVEKVEKHPNADRLTLVTVDYGGKEPKQVVTGAPNLKIGDQGQKVVLAFAGAVLVDAYAKEKAFKELKPTKIRGVPSDAMVCSERELGISDEHEGIILLEEEAPVGVPAADYLGDIVLELDVTPNMARCLSMIGVARETAALTGQKLRYPARKLHATGEAIAGQVEVIIEDEKLSRRYAAALIRGVKIGPSPGWMQRRLLYAGMRPINNIVDITNYIMLEWGQPLHAFDFDLLLKRAEGRPPRITVRPALKGEFITTLDGQKRGLVPADVVIADSAGPIALAGVMGGADTEVNEQTTNVLLESANFDAVSIRQTARRLDLPSEASMRFSRGVHPEIVFPAAEHACELMRCFAGGTVCQGFVDTYPAPIQVKPIELEMSEIRRLLGIDLSPVEAGKILRALEFDVEASDLEDIRVVPPPHRLDIQDEAADLLEELVRIHGYDKLPATLLADQLPDHPTDVNLLREEQLRDLLVQVGLQEVITYSLTQRSRETPFRDNDDDEYISIRNPISSERTVMRRHLLSGVIEIAALNLRHTENVRVFEIGSVYLPRPNDPLPDEPRRLALLLTGYRHDEHWSQPLKRSDNDRLDFFDMKGIIEAILDEFHIDNAGFRPATARYLHPGQSAELVINNLFAGTFGRMHPRLAAEFELGRQPIFIAELDLQALFLAIPDRFTYTPVPRFPAALRDIAVVVPNDVPCEQVMNEIRAAGSDLLRGIRLFDVYRGENIEPGKKSLAFALTYQADDRTLVDKEVDKAHRRIEERLKHVLGAQIRGKD